MLRRVLLMTFLLAALVGCQVVGTTGDTANDPEAAQQFVPPNIAGYNSTDATSVTDALTKAGAAGSLLTGNLPMAGAIAKLDTMIACYRNVGAVAARVYTDVNITANPTAPKVGVLAVINTTRLQNNLMACVLNTNPFSAQSAGGIEPCGGSGDKIVNGETLNYVYAATTPELCATFQAQFN